MNTQPLRTKFAITLSLVVSGLAIDAQAEEKLPAKHVEFFESKIRPVLVTHCYKCHSGEVKEGMPKAGLRLDSKEATLAGGESGPALVPGDASGSLIIEALRHDGLQMPRGKKLPDAVIADFEQWIKLGAPDPRTGGTVVAKRAIDIEEGRKFWAFQSPQKIAAPKVKNAKWAKTEIDRYVLAGLEANNLAPVADSDRRTLIRRVYFDLIGLPPSPEEVQAFVQDRSPKALETVVDRLLESPQFGERWGRHWLDVARYAESNGNADNLIFGHAWRYRDYVIASINADKPFNRFLVEQVAGDLLPTNTSAEKDELLVATGFLALGSKPRAQNNPNFTMDVVAEQIEVTTTGFMGLTVACARCHDHKFDPIPTKDYYSLAGIFASTQTLFGAGVRGNAQGKGVGGGHHKLMGTSEEVAARETYSSSLATARKEQASLIAQLKETGATFKMETPENPASANDNKKNKKKNQAPTPTVKLSPMVSDVVPPIDAPDDMKEKVKELAKQVKQVTQQLHALESRPPSEGLAMGVRDARKVADCAICIRGESSDRGEVVPRGVVTVATLGTAPTIGSEESGRLQLAEWMASPQNPLTSRVIVNRLWKHLFGRGIVPTVDNFGALGEAPSHPALLDHLAIQFVENGWSLKRMVRTLVLTRSYGLSSDHDPSNYERDPDNVYLWRHTPHRLDAESLRDAVLKVSGSLEDAPLRGSSLARHEGLDMRNAKLNLKQLAEAQEKYRSVYLPIVRNGLPEVLDLFDAADPSLVTGSRDVTTVPAQSLYLMNSPFMISHSQRFAKRMMRVEGLNDAQRIDWAFNQALCRNPSSDERARALDLLADARKLYGKNEVRTEPAPSEFPRRNKEKRLEKRGIVPSEPTPDDDTSLRIWGTLTQALFASAEFRYVE